MIYTTNLILLMSGKRGKMKFKINESFTITDLEEQVIYCTSDVFEELLSKFKTIKDVKFEFCSDYSISKDQIIKAGTPLICKKMLKPYGVLCSFQYANHNKIFGNEVEIIFGEPIMLKITLL